jgi:hypothetical protein
MVVGSMASKLHMPNLIERCAVGHVVVAQVVDDDRAAEHELQRVFERKQGTRLDTCIESPDPTNSSGTVHNNIIRCHHS